MIKKAVIPAAGYGTRRLPITKVLPKEMFPIGGRPAIDFIVEEAISSGIEEILIIVSRSKNMIMDYYDRSLELEAFLEEKNKSHLIEQTKLPNVHIQYVRQPYAKGLGDAIKLAKPFVGNEYFAVLLPDEIFLTQTNPALDELMEEYKKHTSSIVGIQQVHKNVLKNYGVIDGEQESENVFTLKKVVEKPTIDPPSNKAIVGRYILSPKIFKFLDQTLPGAGGEIQLTDAINELLIHEGCYAKELSQQRFDIGTEKDYLKLQNLLSKP